MKGTPRRTPTRGRIMTHPTSPRGKTPRWELPLRPLLLPAAFILCMAEGTAAQEPFPSSPPPPLPAQSIEFPPFESLTLENGLRVIFLDHGTQPVSSLRLYVPGGTAADPPDRAGIASMTATVLTRGTENRSAEEISATIEGVGGSLSASAARDFFSVSAVTLAEHAELAFQLLGETVLQATFPQSEVELARRQTLSSLQAQRGQPQAVATRHFARAVYGTDHPYGVRPTPGTIQEIQREDLVAYRDAVLRPEGALLVVAGRLDQGQAEDLVREHLGEWRGAPKAEAESPAPGDAEEARMHLVHRPGATQSVVLVGHLGIQAGNPDAFPLLVMNRILGGGADSRLFRILREERGWTYGSYSELNRPAQRGTFAAVAEVRTEVTDSTVVELLTQMRRLQEEPVPQEELDAARNYLAGSFPLGLETADQVGGQVASTLLLELPLEDLTGYPDRVRSVTSDDVQRVAREYLHPDRATVVVVGDGTQLLAPLEALGLGPVELVDVDGGFLPREEMLGEREPASWDATRLEEGVRRYELFIQGNPMGNAEYRLEREGAAWVATTTITSMAGSQETVLRFGAEDFAPHSIRQDQGQGPLRISVALDVVDGRLTGEVELPAQMGGSREYDQVMPQGTLLPGMDEFALAVAPLTSGARFTIPYLDVVQGSTTTLEARVEGEEEITVSAGTFQTWRVQVTGGEAGLTLFLRREAPHILIRQEFGGQPLRLDLSGLAPLP
jgi:zinc protease